MAGGGTVGVGSGTDWAKVVEQGAAIGTYSDFLLERYLTTRNSFERDVIIRMAKQIADNRGVLDHNLAAEIINLLAKSLR